jgi:hypothetical protein
MTIENLQDSDLTIPWKYGKNGKEIESRTIGAKANGPSDSAAGPGSRLKITDPDTAARLRQHPAILGMVKAGTIRVEN